MSAPLRAVPRPSPLPCRLPGSGRGGGAEGAGRAVPRRSRVGPALAGRALPAAAAGSPAGFGGAGAPGSASSSPAAEAEERGSQPALRPLAPKRNDGVLNAAVPPPVALMGSPGLNRPQAGGGAGSLAKVAPGGEPQGVL